MRAAAQADHHCLVNQLLLSSPLLVSQQVATHQCHQCLWLFVAVYAEKLIAAGIKTDAELLEKCAKPAGRKALAEATEISPKLILKWANHCDLYRINGVGPQFAELLEASGVDTVKELKHRVAENLQAKLEEVNAVKNLTNRVPAVAEVQKMIDQAKELPAVMEY